jgi:hypothetical protein
VGYLFLSIDISKEEDVLCAQRAVEIFHRRKAGGK